MDHLDTHLLHSHDLRLVALSIVIAILASYTALDLAGRVTVTRGRARLVWLGGGAIAMGLGIWSMHFTAMLAFQLPIPIAYDIPTVLVSLLVAVMASGLALFIASRLVLTLPQMFGGGIVMGFAIAGMHYIGMAAMRLQATLKYAPFPFTLSIVIAIAASVVALWLAFQLRGETTARWSWLKIGSAIVMGAAISGMHYTGMAAAIFTPNDVLVVDRAYAFDISLLGVVSIVTVTFIILSFALLLSVIDQRLAAQITASAESEARHHSVLQTLNAELEVRVSDLTRTTEMLKTSAEISRRLSTFIDLNQLLTEIVNQIKESFGYYHVHIYLLDKTSENLVIVEGTDLAGAEMKARAHSIPLAAPRSLVARAARTDQIVRVDNVREAEDWLPNSLLPDTHSEMAVPITLEGNVVGVLDVQQNKIAGLSENDANLVHFLTNHVAVAIHNARQFAQVNAALVEARELQRQYIVQSWDRSRMAKKNVGRVQFSLGESTTLNEAIIANAQQQALSHQKPIVVAFNEQPHNTHYALVSPVMLRDVVIGDLQLHEIDLDRVWTEGELALINAVVDQVAQTAENLRLLDETQERASREQLVSQISNKLRHAPDMDSLLKVAVTELSRVLNPARTFVHMDLNEAQKPAEAKLVEDSTPNGFNHPVA